MKHFIDKISSEITIEDFKSDNMRLVAERCGPEVAISLLKEISGIQIYINEFSSEEGILKKYFERRLPELSSNPNFVKIIAIETRVNEKRARKLIQDLVEERKLPLRFSNRKVDYNQSKLFTEKEA